MTRCLYAVSIGIKHHNSQVMMKMSQHMSYVDVFMYIKYAVIIRLTDQTKYRGKHNMLNWSCLVYANSSGLQI